MNFTETLISPTKAVSFFLRTIRLFLTIHSFPLVGIKLPQKPHTAEMRVSQ